LGDILEISTQPMPTPNRKLITHHSLLITSLLLLAACTFGFDPSIPVTVSGGGSTPASGDTAAVTRVVDGDTIDVTINGQPFTVRYVGVNTPERDEACYSEARNANAALVQGQTVRLVRDVSETDRFGRLLRYVYVGSTFVNQALVEQGWAEAASYPPDTAFIPLFQQFELEAANAQRGCHVTGIFNDGSNTR
jgi:endonuclease YncB( thermonuclease family)